MYKYKFTSSNKTTYNNCKWILNRWKKTDGIGKLCGPGWLHCYDDPLLAELHNPVHGEYPKDALLWKVEVDGKELRDGQMKCGWTKMQLVKQIKRKYPTDIQRIAYGILCAKAVYKDKQWNKWANDWLSGKDRSEKAAYAAYAADAAYAVDAAANTAEWATRQDKKLNLIEIAKQAMKY
jgi:hypothetical protein